MRTIFWVILLIFIVSCGGNGSVNINDPEFLPNDPVIDDYRFIIGADPIIQRYDFSTCPGKNPATDYRDYFCGNFDRTSDFSFEERSSIYYVGPFKAWRAGYGQPVFDGRCGSFTFTIKPLNPDVQKSYSLQVSPDVEANVPSSQKTNLAKTHFWDTKSDGLRVSFSGGDDCFQMTRAKFAIGAYSDVIKPTMRDGVVEIGRLSDLVGHSATLYSWSQRNAQIRVISGKKIIVGFSSNNPASIKTTSNVNAFVYACLDDDEDGTCDFAKGATCWNLGGDYYNDACCGFDTNIPVCNYTSSLDAYCANTTQGYMWLARDMPGRIIPVGSNCPVVDAVSNGSHFLTCEKSVNLGPNSISIQEGFLKIKKGAESHEYLCKDEKLYECGSWSDAQNFDEGDSLSFLNLTYYCSRNNTWEISLDDYESSCEKAGFDWTGLRCCGEIDDDPSFADFRTNSEGMCMNNVFYENGQVFNESILVYFGFPVVCQPSLTNFFNRSQTPLFANVYPLIHGVCGTFLANATLNSHAVCSPNGWVFRNTPTFNFLKDAPTNDGFPKGCCASSQCWSGFECIDQGEYFQAGGEGFKCG